ncbi:MAG TPA: flagellar biosynthetic protein FliO [Verrucomicrobiae bacterium]
MNAPLFYFRRLFAHTLALTAICGSLVASAQTNDSPATNLTAKIAETVATQEIPSTVSTETNLVTESISVATNATSEIAATNAAVALAPISQLQPNDPLPSPLASLGRVMLMLAVVLTIFIGGVWLFRNWQRFTVHRGNAPRLNVIESRSLGGRHAIYVIGYENERLLISSSPNGINLLTHLQPSDEPAATEKPAAPAPTFAATLAQMLKGKQS